MTLLLGKKQECGNITIVPILNDSPLKLDILDLTTGFKMGLVEASECEQSTVGTIMVKNNATSPLLLVDGEEVAGAKQNRIIGQSMLIPPNTSIPIPVNCSEQGRWNYKSEFKHSNYMANSETRCRKAEYNMDNSIRASQGAVWDSIEDLQVKRNSFSKTSALRDNYEKIEKTNDDYLKHFGIYENQVGVIARLENKVGLDVFANHSLYEQYSDMILKSYIIDDVGNNSLIKDDFDFEAVLDNINEKYFNKRNTVGLGQSYFIKTNNGSGTSLIYENELIHANFFYNNRLRNLKL